MAGQHGNSMATAHVAPEVCWAGTAARIRVAELRRTAHRGTCSNATCAKTETAAQPAVKQRSQLEE